MRKWIKKVRAKWILYRLRLEAGELVTSGDDDVTLYPDVFGKYNI